MTTHEALEALVKAGAVATTIFKSDGLRLGPWPVAWFELSDDQKLVRWMLVGPTEHVREFEVLGINPDDEGRHFELELPDYWLTVEAKWGADQQDILDQWQRYGAKPEMPATGVRYATV